jgi:hypothetical protein
MTMTTTPVTGSRQELVRAEAMNMTATTTLIAARIAWAGMEAWTSV